MSFLNLIYSSCEVGKEKVTQFSLGHKETNEEPEHLKRHSTTRVTKYCYLLPWLAIAVQPYFF